MEESTEVRTDGNSLLKAVSLCRLRLTRLLLEGGAYINESNEQGETPLMVACRTRHSDSQSVAKHKVVRYLLENGADPNIQDKTGKTALMHACLEEAGPEILLLLLNSQADPTLEDHCGASALVHALNSGNRDALRILLDACKAKGKEVIIITTNKSPSGHQMTRQYLNVPPPCDPEERLPHTHMAPQTGSPHLGHKKSPFAGPTADPPSSPPVSPVQTPSPLYVPSVEKRLNFQRLGSEQWLKGPSAGVQAPPLAGELRERSAEDERPPRVAGQGRHPPFSRHHSIDVKDAAGLLKALDTPPGSVAPGKRLLGRKMSYDGAASSLHSASHPNLNQPGPSRAQKDSPDTQLHVSSLQNVVRRRSIGIGHYSSDSQLPQFGSRDSKSPASSTAGTERLRLLFSRSSNLSGSRESLESAVPQRGAAGLERRGSGALLLDHIAHTRPGFLPPLNPHIPIPDIGASLGASRALGGSSKTLSGGPAGSKPVLPCVPIFLKDLKAKKMLWRRHSMQSEQITQLVDFEENLQRQT
ncbi:ankyrin repeat domain 34Bb [Synchiropus splendidus]|uniref:ankyrin repeat domain 34Bb n=1 Tax=Synchiropus splendidus TaxID=270530 RepID=UPI00237D361F|nr:ankyrin repeat domain 34Bb [Synchiropus splendidus]